MVNEIEWIPCDVNPLRVTLREATSTLLSNVDLSGDHPKVSKEAARLCLHKLTKVTVHLDKILNKGDKHDN